jgi:DNA-binding transcriptional regulator LsrR (DeoR family)
MTKDTIDKKKQLNFTSCVIQSIDSKCKKAERDQISKEVHQRCYKNGIVCEMASMFLNAACLAEKQQIPILKYFV